MAGNLNQEGGPPDQAMRIVGGKYRGRSLATPRTGAIRPTTDRTRESLFNILTHRHSEVLSGRVLDLFAGTGALGFEALSRGAAFALFVERSAEGRALLRANIEAFGAAGCTKVFRRDATALGEAGVIPPFDLAFADPPYGKNLGNLALRSAALGGWLKPGALVLLEERADIEPDAGPHFEVLENRGFGGTRVHFFVYGS